MSVALLGTVSAVNPTKAAILYDLADGNHEGRINAYNDWNTNT
ncbi:MAG: hypothetical protein WAM14_17460 [Candidatus Nitrosopolaris sp.]